jgi:conjugative relaxase-like TrwC/TraI family protein
MNPCMITVTQIRNGAGYLSRHLSANDYYSEGERVEGYWLGKGAEKLGLHGAVKEEQFEALRTNRHPFTGEKLTPRMHKVAFHDIVLSAPKSFSIAAIVGQDERLVAAFQESSRYVLMELEKHAAVRVRGGEMVRTEAIKTTGNVACAAFQHDSSRMLGPQLHTHFVVANVSFDTEQQRWMALQPRPMLEASKREIRAMFYDDLAQRAEKLGYLVTRSLGGFRIEGVSQRLEEKFSQRSVQRRKFENRYRELFRRDASKERIEAFIKEGRTAAKARFAREFESEFRRAPSSDEVDYFVKDWRSASLKRTSTAEVRQNQLNQLTPEEGRDLNAAVRSARKISAERAFQPNEMVEAPRIAAREDKEVKCDFAAETSAPTVSPKPRRMHSNGHPAIEKIGEREREESRRISVGRIEAMRRMRRGMAVAQALRGHPVAFMIQQLSTLSRRHNETDRRTR